MRYISTRSGGAPRQFCEILLEGLAPDGGLYLPERYPSLSVQDLSRLRTTFDNEGYANLAFEVLKFFVDDIDVDDLKGYV